MSLLKVDDESEPLLSDRFHDLQGGSAMKNDQRESRPFISRGTLNVILAIFNVLTNVMMNVSLPVYAGTMNVIGSDTFALLMICNVWFMLVFFLVMVFIKLVVNKSTSLKPCAAWKWLFVMGLTTTLNGIFVVFASPPNRTPPYLQGILATTNIPFTVLARFLLLRKSISIRRLVCVAIVLVALFITVEPQIWNLDGSGGSSGSANESAASKILWPMMFAVGFIPVGINNAVCEKVLKKDQAHSFNFIMWTQVFQVLTIFPMFWVDFIPGFGEVSSVGEFRDKLSTGIVCTFSSAATCNGVSGKMWIFIVGYCFGNLFQFLLIEYAEGAIYAVVVQSLVTPTATIFWTFFKFEETQNHFFWSPKFDITTAFTLGGLIILMPTVIIYNYFSRQEASEKLNIELTVETPNNESQNTKQIIL